MSVRFPPDVYEELRRAAFERRTYMNTLVVEGAKLRLAQLKAAAEVEQQEATTEGRS